MKEDPAEGYRLLKLLEELEHVAPGTERIFQLTAGSDQPAIGSRAGAEEARRRPSLRAGAAWPRNVRPTTSIVA